MPRASLQPEALRVLFFCTALLSTASLTAIRVSGTISNLSSHNTNHLRSHSFFADSSTTTLTCAGDFTLRERSCYSFPGSAVRRSFHHAERHCTKLKASLTSLLSPAEENFVIELVENETAFWIGLTDRASSENTATETRFKWTDGRTLSSHAHWRVGEPSSAVHLRCVQVDRKGWSLASGGCASTKLPFVCKKQGELLSGPCTHVQRGVFTCVHVLPESMVGQLMLFYTITIATTKHMASI